MNRYSFLLILTLLCLQSMNVYAQNEMALVRAVKARMDKVKDYKAAGVMAIDAAFIKAPASAITVYYKKPDRFSIQKQDGLSILPKGGVSINLASLLGGDNFTAVGAGNAVVNGINTKVIKLLPLDANSDVVLSTLYIDEKKEVVHKAQITTRDNGSYEMDLSYGRYVTYGLPDKVVFTFNTKEYKLPKGLTFEYEKGGAQKAEANKDRKGIVTISYNSYVLNKGVEDAVFKN